MAPEIRHWPDGTMERRAYEAVGSVPVQEENDRNRLGYHLLLHLRGELPDLDGVLHVAQGRLLCGRDEAKRIISAALTVAKAPAAQDAPSDEPPLEEAAPESDAS